MAALLDKHSPRGRKEGERGGKENLRDDRKGDSPPAAGTVSGKIKKRSRC